MIPFVAISSVARLCCPIVKLLLARGEGGAPGQGLAHLHVVHLTFIELFDVADGFASPFYQLVVAVVLELRPRVHAVRQHRTQELLDW